jgi:molybdopterin/thiamine biosynthesis adenylyltransferase
MPPPGAVATCETAGILGTIVAVIAALEVTEGLKILMDRREELLRSLVMVDVWHGDFERAAVQKGKEPCPVCDQGRYELLQAQQGSMATVLCGRLAVQVSPWPVRALDLAGLARRLASAGPVEANGYLVRLDVDDKQLTIFADGRAIVKGTDDPALARSLYARFVGA